jgi:hypothetical protein
MEFYTFLGWVEGRVCIGGLRVDLWPILLQSAEPEGIIDLWG